MVNSDVVYEADDAGVEAQKATPLLPAKKKKPATGAAAGSANYIAPPPPPSPSYNQFVIEYLSPAAVQITAVFRHCFRGSELNEFYRFGINPAPPFLLV